MILNENGYVRLTAARVYISSSMRIKTERDSSMPLMELTMQSSMWRI